MLEFLRGRDDVVVFGAQAVNAYVGEPRMSQDIDLLTTHADSLAEELRQFLSDRFHIAVRVCVIGAGKGYRLFQIAKLATAIWSMCETPNRCRMVNALKTCW